MRGWAALLVLLAPWASAEDPERTFTENRAPLGPAEVEVGPTTRVALERGAAALGLPVSTVADFADGVERIYQRNYAGAKTHFQRFQAAHPELAGVEAVGNLLIYQALMLENFDYRYEARYAFHAERAYEQLTAAQQVPGHDAIELMLLGGVVGVESIHTMRKGEYLPALTRGLEAVRTIGRARELAPDLVDPLLGDGLYKYWRSVVTINSPLLPDFSDRRQEGIADMRRAESDSVFVGPAATLALAFAYIEERDLDTARKYCEKNQRAYPSNIINNLLLARLQIAQRRYGEARASLQRILATDPNHQRVHYYEATLHLHTRELERSLTSIERYLAFDLEPANRSMGLTRKGDVAYALRRFDDAARAWEQAVALDGSRVAKASLERLERLRKEGRLPG